MGHWLALQVVVPLICAPICVLIRRSYAVWLFSVFCAWIGLAIACRLLLETATHGALSYAVGGWQPPWGIEYRVDLLNAYVLIIVNGLAAVIISGGHALVSKGVASDRVYLLYAAILLHITGINGVLVTGDAFNLFVFIEIASLSSYGMIAAGRNNQSLLAAYHYLIYGTMGASFILIAVGILYAMTGTLNMADLAARLPALADARATKSALAFFTVGIMLKCAIFPLHVWLPAAYTRSPSTVAVFLAGTTTKVFLYVLIRFLYGVFGVDYVFSTLHMDNILLPLSIAGMLYGSAMAIRQDNLRAMLAWSSIAQVGYMVLALSLGTTLGVVAAMVYMFNHAIIKSALFLIVVSLWYRFGTVSLKKMPSATAAPWLSAAFVLTGLSLIGMPLTAGFVSKWYLLSATLDAGLWFASGAVVISSLLAVVYVWRVVEVLYRGRPAQTVDVVENALPVPLIFALSALVIANIFLGLNTQLTVGVAEQAVAGLATVESMP